MSIPSGQLEGLFKRPDDNEGTPELLSGLTLHPMQREMEVEKPEYYDSEFRVDPEPSVLCPPLLTFDTRRVPTGDSLSFGVCMFL